MTYCRRFVMADWKPVIEIARGFHAESPVHSPYPFEETRVRQLLSNAMASADWLPAVAVDGGQIVGILLLFHMPMFFGPASEVGDLAFYVVPDRRGTRAAQLLLEYGERWALMAGAQVIRLGITTGIRDHAVARFLSKNGYAQIGALLEKALPSR